MDKKQFYMLSGKLNCGGVANVNEVMDLLCFTNNLLDLIIEAEESNGDVFGTEGWEHAIGWE